MDRRLFLQALGCGCLSFGLTSCTTVAITDRKQLNFIPEAKINAKAAQIYEEVKKKEKLSNDQSKLEEIIQIGKRMEYSIGEYFDIDKSEMGVDISLGALRGLIMKQAGVLNIVDMKVYNKVGGQYSQSISTQPYIPQTNREIQLIDDTIYAQPNEILQIRFPDTDIAIRVKKPEKPTF